MYTCDNQYNIICAVLSYLVTVVVTVDGCIACEVY